VTRIFISPAADGDLEDIWLTIAADSPAAATRITRAIGAKIEHLANHPRLGPRRKDILPATRILIEGPYLVLYETHPRRRRRPSRRSRDRPRCGRTPRPDKAVLTKATWRLRVYPLRIVTATILMSAPWGTIETDC
jgi:toxin ParE1/3/4